MKAWLVISAAALLAGCVTDSTPINRADTYDSYRDMVIADLSQTFAKAPNSSIPQPVQVAYENCSTDYALSFLTAEERARLDKWARGNEPMTAGELKDYQQRFQARAGGPLTYAGLDRLRAVCPGDVDSFKQYMGGYF